MPTFEREGAEIWFEEHGSGFPVLLFAPGGMRSAARFWEQSPWNPIEVLAPHFRVIAMDQRNAGRSRGPITGQDGWHTYSSDHVALLDHLEVERTHLLGGCIGGPYCMGVIERAPERVASAVLQQPIGLDQNREAFHQMFDGWADALRGERPEVSDEAWRKFRDNMYGGDFLFNVSRDFVRGVRQPLLVLMGDDLYHPQSTSREIASLAARAELVERWNTPDVIEATQKRVLAFLEQHTR